MFGGILIGVACLIGVFYLINNHQARSLNYRKLLTNLYVTAKIKEIANKDGVDLAKELKEYKELFSKGKGNIDDAIEDKLSDKLSEKSK